MPRRSYGGADLRRAFTRGGGVQKRLEEVHLALGRHGGAVGGAIAMQRRVRGGGGTFGAMHAAKMMYIRISVGNQSFCGTLHLTCCSRAAAAAGGERLRALE